MSHRKLQVVALLKAIETGTAEPLAIINADKYIQHNLAAADELAGLGVLLATLPEGSARVNTARVLDETYANKELVRAFVDDILVHGRMQKLAGYFNDDKYIQHNPHIADNLSGLGSGLQAMAAQGITISTTGSTRCLARGISCLWSARARSAGSRRRFTICSE